MSAGILLGLTMRGALHAQAPAPAERTIRFTVFAARPIAEVAFVPREKAAPKDVVFYPTARSPRYEYRGVMPLRFLDRKTGSVVAEAEIPPDVRDAFLLFSPIVTPATPDALRYRIAVLDDSAVRHGPGGLAIINLSGLALSGTIDRTSVSLAAGLNPTMPIGLTTQVVLRTNFKERSYQVYAEELRIAGSERALLILFPPFYPGSLEVQWRLLVDEPPASPK